MTLNKETDIGGSNTKFEVLGELVGEYDVIYADPPYRNNLSSSKKRAIETHNPTMSLEDIKKLKVPSAPNSVLLQWVPATKLVEGLEIMAAWGFAYKTHMVWNKTRHAEAYWGISQHQLLLIGTKGKMRLPSQDKRGSSVYTEITPNFSSKPYHFYQIIQRMFPGKRYIELFARQSLVGWATWGNEVYRDKT
jgi:N6-adenosine-specific RNA methylase IME4